MNGIRSWWGWGWEQQAVPDAECVQLASALQLPSSAPLCVPAIADLSLSPPRITAPPVLGAIVSDQPGHRAGHTYGKAYRDVVRALQGDVRAAPDLVAFAKCEADVAAVLDWAADHDVVVVPFGGGSSVVGGVEYRGDRAAVSLDLTRMNRVLEIDPSSRGGADRGRRSGPGTGGPTAPARLHLAALSTELRVFHARRLVGYQGRWALRGRAHPHRRFRGVDAGGHPHRSHRVLAPAWFRGGTITGSAVLGFRRGARGHH